MLRPQIDKQELLSATAHARLPERAPIPAPIPTVPPRQLPAMRRYHIRSLDASGSCSERHRIAPALQSFEHAFSAFARGTLISTADGPVAVEDLLPGTLVQTAENGLQVLQWTGAMTIMPVHNGISGQMRPGLLTRISADSFGLGRPSPDLLLGPSARLLPASSRFPALVTGSDASLVASSFADGDAVIQVSPVSPVQVYHLSFAGQQVICANGLNCESYHPGAAMEIEHSGEMLSLFLSLFPHIDTLSDFGPLRQPHSSLPQERKVMRR